MINVPLQSFPTRAIGFQSAFDQVDAECNCVIMTSSIKLHYFYYTLDTNHQGKIVLIIIASSISSYFIIVKIKKIIIVVPSVHTSSYLQLLRCFYFYCLIYYDSNNPYDYP